VRPITLGGATIFNNRNPEPLVVAKNLACRRGSDWLFTDLSFDIFPGQVTWLTGQNGRGKTSLLRLLVGLSSPDRGEISWVGSPTQDRKNSFDRLVYIGHNNGLKDGLTVTESLQFLAQLGGQQCTNQVLTLALEKLGMSHRCNALVRTLSQGQRRRAALARLALESMPSLWVLDEPYDALDAAGTAVVNQLIGDHVRRGGSVFLTSHIAVSLNASLVKPLDLDRGVFQ
jgi:heme exporter protein A